MPSDQSGIGDKVVVNVRQREPLWRVYYVSGTTSNQIGLVGVGVIGVAERDPDHEWTYWVGKDWYILQKDGHWMGCDTNGMIDQVTHRLDELRFICQGRTLVPYAEYAEIINRMQSECKPPKTGWHPGEKP